MTKVGWQKKNPNLPNSKNSFKLRKEASTLCVTIRQTDNQHTDCTSQYVTIDEEEKVADQRQMLLVITDQCPALVIT